MDCFEQKIKMPSALADRQPKPKRVVPQMIYLQVPTPLLLFSRPPSSILNESMLHTMSMLIERGTETLVRIARKTAGNEEQGTVLLVSGT